MYNNIKHDNVCIIINFFNECQPLPFNLKLL